MEVSVDVLADTGGIVLAAVGRQHDEQSRRRVIVDNGPAREIAETLVRTSEVAYLSNTQVRWWQDRPYLLELNTRAAGGLFQTALAGVNLPAAAVRLALGEPVGPLVPNFGAEYTDVASFVQLRPSR
jgi:biotin carboxylase